MPSAAGRESKEEIEAGAAAEGWAQWWAERWGQGGLSCQYGGLLHPRAPQEEISSLAAGNNLLEGEILLDTSLGQV
jgi:hypothetical protein